MGEKALDIGLLFPKNDEVRLLLETTSTDIFDGNSKTFAEDGLYSNKIYDTIGSADRNNLFSYKKLGVTLVHPKLYKSIINLSSLFERIVSSKAFVIFNNKTKSFDESDFDNGFTGYSYFVKYIHELSLPTTDSDTRKEEIKTIEIYKKKGELFIDNMYIIPAGMREYKISEDGRDEEDEINDLYKVLIRLSNMLINSNVDKDNLDILDPTVVKLQNNIIDIYDYILGMMGGKHKRLRGDWLSRTIDGGTRSVLSSIPVNIADLDDTSSLITFNDTLVGVYQYIMMYQEMVRYHLLNKILYHSLNRENNRATLFNQKTYKTETVELDRKTFELWTSVDGIGSILYKLSDDKIKNSNIIIGKHYLCLKEIIDGEVYLRFNTADITDVANTEPLTYGELMAILATYLKGKVAATLSRYPITTQGSNYLTIPVYCTTIESTKKIVHVPNLVGEDILEVVRYPSSNGSYISTTSPHYSRIQALNADFDGDKGAVLPSYSEEAVARTYEIFNSINHYIKPDGTPTHSLADDISSMVVSVLTKKRK